MRPLHQAQAEKIDQVTKGTARLAELKHKKIIDDWERSGRQGRQPALPKPRAIYNPKKGHTFNREDLNAHREEY